VGFIPNLLPALMEDQALIEDLCRYADSILTERQVRQKWHLADDNIWHALGTDESFVERVELERTRRIRTGATKRELAQLHITKGPAILDSIAINPKANDKHRIDAIKALDQLAGFAPQVAAEQERVIIKIDLGADTRAKGLPNDPGDVLIVDVAANPKPNPATIGATPIPDNTINNPIHSIPDDPIPVRRGPGRPKGSKNKPKPPELPILSKESESWKT